MQCDDESYESIDNDLCTEEMEDDITAFIPTEDENGASDDNDGNVEISDAVTRSKSHIIKPKFRIFSNHDHVGIRNLNDATL